MTVKTETDKQIENSRERFEQAFDEVFSHLNFEPKIQRALKAVMLCKGGSAILQGIPGTGKTTAIETISEAFNLKIGKITCSPQRVTLEGSFYRLSIPALLKDGKEKIEWKPISEADVIFISEINRAPQSFQDELIDLLQYKELEAYSNIKKVQNHALMFFDMNPYRGGLDKAISDRPLCSITFSRPDFFKRYSITNTRFNKTSVRDVRKLVEPKANLDDLLICQDQVEEIEIDPTILALSTLITESFSSCIHNRDFASDRWIPPCSTDKLDKLGEVVPGAKCTYHGQICSCIKAPLAYRIDEALTILAKSFCYLDNETVVNKDHMLEALELVVGNRLELRDSIAKHWVNPSVWVRNELINHLNKNKLNQWGNALTLWNKLRKNNLKPDEKETAIEQLRTFGKANLELRPILDSLGIDVMVSADDEPLDVEDDY